MTTTPLPSLASSPKSSATAGSKAGHHHEAAADGGLGFLAELAAAIGAVAPLAPTPAVAHQPGLPGTAADVSGDAPTRTPKATATVTGTALPLPLAGGTTPPATGLGATVLRHAPGSVPSGRTATATTPALRATTAVTSTGIAPDGTPTSPRPAAGTVAAQTTPAPAMPIEVTAAPQRAGAHHAKDSDAATAAPDQATPSTPSPAVPPTPAPTDGALLTDSAAAGIDPLSAAAAATPTTVTTDDGSQQTTAVLRQVFPEVTRVATTPGTHRLAITLHPDDLGEVRVTVVVRGDSVRVNVATDPTSGIARTALEHNAPELRRLLESTGANARIEFRDLAANPGTGLGSAPDDGRQQQPQAHTWAQSPDNPDGQHRRQERPQTEPPPGPAVTTTTTRAGSQPGPQIPTVRTAASGLDQLI